MSRKKWRTADPGAPDWCPWEVLIPPRTTKVYFVINAFAGKGIKNNLFSIIVCDISMLHLFPASFYHPILRLIVMLQHRKMEKHRSNISVQPLGASCLHILLWGAMHKIPYTNGLIYVTRIWVPISSDSIWQVPDSHRVLYLTVLAVVFVVSSVTPEEYRYISKIRTRIIPTT